VSKFEIYKDKKGETRFRYRAANGEVVFSSEAYKAKASATKAIESIKKNAATAPVEEVVAAAKAKAPAKAAAGKKAAVKVVAAKAPAAKAKPAAAKAKRAAAAKAKPAAKPAAKSKPAKAMASAK
jgi:uncharacterized protein YegP (UPF0339 family)